MLAPCATAVALLILSRVAGSLALDALNRREVRRRSAAPPPVALAVMDAATYGRSVEYTLARSRFASFEGVWEAVVLAVALFSGWLPRLHAWVAGWGAPGAAWTEAVFVLGALGLVGVPALPLEAWEQFRLEGRFGFNRTTPGLWILDRVKGLLLGAGLGLPLFWALFAVVHRVGASWWVWGFALVAAFQVGLAWLYPLLILPLFNRLVPLPPGDLRNRLLALAGRTGFRAADVQVMDGSRRSGHSNAFFTGFGRLRRIVLFDTLISRLEPAELEGVLAHEIGHWKRGHVLRGIGLGLAALFAGFWVIARLARSPAFCGAFGFRAGDTAPVLVLCLLAGGAATFWIGPLFKRLSRRHEYEADAFAAQAVGGASPLVGALRKLTRDNLGNLTPHPWYSAFHHSHPTLAEREAALGRLIGRVS